MLKIIKLLLIFLFLVIILVGSWLYSGIKIDSFSFGNFSVSQFYIKLNKKLIVDVEKIVFKSKKSKVKSSIEDLKKDIELLPKILKFFEKIDVERLIIDGNAFTIALDDEKLFLDNKFINISSKFDISSKKIVFDLYSLYLKDFELLFQGKIDVDYYSEVLNYSGNYLYDNIEGNINIDSTNSLLDFHLDSNYFNSLKFLKKYIKLPSIAEQWMYDNVQGNLKLQNFRGSIDLNKYKILMKTLNGTALIDNAQVKFNKNQEPIFVKKVDVKFENNSLSFKLNSPKYLNIPLDGSSVTINHLTSLEKGRVHINIKAKTKFDKNIQNLLKTYKIKVPLIQKKGLTNARVNLVIPYRLSKYKMITKGEFDISNSNISINNKFDFYTKKAKVFLNGSIIDIKNSNFKYKNMIDSFVNLKLDTKTLELKGDADIKSLYIGNKDNEIINIKNYKTPVFLQLKDKVKIDIEKLLTKIKIDDYIYVDIDDLSKLYSYSKLLKENSLKNGDINLKIKNEKDLTFQANVSGLDFPIEKNNKKIKTLKVQGSVKDEILSISSIDKNIRFKQIKNNKPDLYLENIDVNLSSKSGDKDNLEFPSLKLELVNSKLILKESSYSLKKAKINSSAKNIFFKAQTKDLNIPLLKNGKKVTELNIQGIHTKNETKINTLSNEIILSLKKDNLKIRLKNYDVLYKTDNKLKNQIENFSLLAKNSNIIVNDKYKFLSDDYEIRIKDNSTYLHLNHGKTDFTFKESKNKKVDIFANDISSKFLNTIFDKKIFQNGKFMLLANGILDDLNGKFLVENTTVNDLGSLGGYKIKNGNIKFNYSQNKESLKVQKLVSIGDTIDMDGNAHVNLKNMTLKSKIKLIFLKEYSGLVGSIPVLNYLILGKDKRVETLVEISGDLLKPKVSTHIAKDTFSVPINIVKRVLSSPVELLEFLNESIEKK